MEEIKYVIIVVITIHASMFVCMCISMYQFHVISNNKEKERKGWQRIVI